MMLAGRLCRPGIHSRKQGDLFQLVLAAMMALSMAMAIIAFARDRALEGFVSYAKR